MALVPTGNAENICLDEFIPSNGKTLLERVQPFSRYFRESQATGKALYSREILGPIENRSWVRDNLRKIPRKMVMLGSNNYLGLVTHPHVQSAVIQAIRDYGTGMGGPPLLNGMSALHRQLERRLTSLKKGVNSDEYDAMLFGSGFQANLGWARGLLRKGDVLIYDEFSHASLYDGISQVRAECGDDFRAIRFRHNDVSHLSALLNRYSKRKQGQIFVAIEGVYSMDGDLAPMREIASLCGQFEASLIVDDAHGTGVLGNTGAGTIEHFGLDHQVDISMGTFSKTFGVTGGFLVARKEIIDYLRFFSRSYMFSAHLPPSTVAAVLAGLDVMVNEPELRSKLIQNAATLKSGLQELGFTVKQEAAIIPILIPPQIDIRDVNLRLHEEDLFLNSIAYPAVSRADQRLRASVMATHTSEDLEFALKAFEKIKKEFKI